MPPTGGRSSQNQAHRVARHGAGPETRTPNPTSNSSSVVNASGFRGLPAEKAPTPGRELVPGHPQAPVKSDQAAARRQLDQWCRVAGCSRSSVCVWAADLHHLSGLAQRPVAPVDRHSAEPSRVSRHLTRDANGLDLVATRFCTSLHDETRSPTNGVAKATRSQPRMSANRTWSQRLPDLQHDCARRGERRPVRACGAYPVSPATTQARCGSSLWRANMAMYAARNAGRSGLRVYDAERSTG